MSFTLSSNLAEVVLDLSAQLKSLSDDNGASKDKLMRMVASEMVTILHDRIHVQGQNTAGQDFGEYSNSYLKLRKKNGLTGRKVILRFTGQLEKLTIVPDNKGNYSIGWISENNLTKAQYMEQRYGIIYQFNENEANHAIAVANDFITQLFK